MARRNNVILFPLIEHCPKCNGMIVYGLKKKGCVECGLPIWAIKRLWRVTDEILALNKISEGGGK